MTDLIASLDECRLEAGVSIAVLARTSGIDRSNLSKILNGHVDPQLSTVVSIADALAVDLHCVRTSTSAPPTSTAGRAR